MPAILTADEERGEAELCRNLGDGADQAAWLSVGVTISMPLENLTPAITFGK